MIDGRRFSRGAMLDTKALQEVTVRRLKPELPDKGFQPRSIKRAPVHSDRGRAAGMFALLDEIAHRQRASATAANVVATSWPCC